VKKYPSRELDYQLANLTAKGVVSRIFNKRTKSLPDSSHSSPQASNGNKVGGGGGAGSSTPLSLGSTKLTSFLSLRSPSRSPQFHQSMNDSRRPREKCSLYSSPGCGCLSGDGVFPRCCRSCFHVMAFASVRPLSPGGIVTKGSSVFQSSDWGSGYRMWTPGSGSPSRYFSGPFLVRIRRRMLGSPSPTMVWAVQMVREQLSLRGESCLMLMVKLTACSSGSFVAASARETAEGVMSTMDH
jgi:hypothetical protein